jgi:toxin CcdB
MAQFDVYQLAGGELVVDIQTELLGDFRSRLVVPLMAPHDAPMRHPRLNPSFEISGEVLVLVPQFMIAVDRSELRRRVDSFDRHYDEIKSAYDMLFNGF